MSRRIRTRERHAGKPRRGVMRYKFEGATHYTEIPVREINVTYGDPIAITERIVRRLIEPIKQATFAISKLAATLPEFRRVLEGGPWIDQRRVWRLARNRQLRRHR